MHNALRQVFGTECTKVIEVVSSHSAAHPHDVSRELADDALSLLHHCDAGVDPRARLGDQARVVAHPRFAEELSNRVLRWDDRRLTSILLQISESEPPSVAKLVHHLLRAREAHEPLFSARPRRAGVLL
jgi:hypothetical protein